MIKQTMTMVPRFAPKRFLSRGFVATTPKPLTKYETDIIKATVPILEVGGETLTKHFYEVMLREYPVVVPFFNKAHQSSGDQPRALANAVLMYAKNIDKLDQLGPLVGQIVNKHVSLNINPDHYAVVGTCLLRAIREVLGPKTATDAVISAWAAAYGQLSTILINAEEYAYAEKAAAPGGWRGDREFIVMKKVKESEEITSFYLHPKDGKGVIAYQAGQYIGLHITIDGEEVRRNYSLSTASNGQFYRISVKKEHGGLVSNHLHDKVKVGEVLSLFPPAGDFKLVTCADATAAATAVEGGCTYHATCTPSVVTKPLVFIAGGVGITPCIAMLEETLRTEATLNRPIYFIHAARNAEVQGFQKYLTDLANQHKNLHYFSDYTTDPVACTQAVLAKFLLYLPEERNIDVYFLGPLGFMISVKKGLTGLGVDESNLHWEFFGPNKNLN